jgi:hypothetical protein
MRCLQVDLRRLHLTLGHVLVPGFQPLRHEGGTEGVQVAADGLLGDSECARQLGAVPDLAVVVVPRHRIAARYRGPSGRKRVLG